ncbi:Ni/Fe hydrogenase subunit alpha [Desulfobulbus sp.]|uniref:Ni/Fe hydrogenase subunit alpha n=1 Tax=Desulfobulbus sp. TaxID=895 RepID=UPI00286EBBCC|nr:Ni/Fe hydrogenase subunit alpha [Desulfobulbus sp.]
MQQITIEPVSRIEGHAAIRLFLDDAGRVRDARFQVNQFRGFERFAVGRPFFEMPALTARTCGICPVSHELASAKACDQLLAVAIPAVAAKLRRILNLAQLIQSHALSFFYLAAPDLLLGMDHPPESRNFFGLATADPQFARDGIRLRQFGQQVIERLAGRRIHPSWAVPGGVGSPLAAPAREAMLAELPAIVALIRTHLDRFKHTLDRHREHDRFFARFPSLFLGLANEAGTLEHYDGRLRFIDAEGAPVADDLDPGAYRQAIGEAVEPWTYLKFPYYLPHGYPQGMYRVGPLARLNLARRCGTELADRELALFRALEPGPVLGTFQAHYARLIEILYATEHIERLLAEPDILDQRVRAVAGINNLEGVGIAEAPRGTLIHHYKVNEDGLIEWINLIIATGHNNLAMQRGILQAAQHFLDGTPPREGLLNRIEAVIRSFDPCLACATHAVGTMPLTIDLVGPDGRLLDRLQR